MSKLFLFDFECPCGQVFEELVQPTERSAQCPRCSSPARRLISPVKIDKLGMATQDGASPTSIDYFERVHRQRKAIEDKRHADHGDYGSQAGSDGGCLTPEKAGAFGN